MQRICGWVGAKSLTECEAPDHFTSPTPAPVENYSSYLPVDDPLPDVVEFPGRNFHITGKFAYGTRKTVLQAIEARGGIATDKPPNDRTHYLVIGVFASRDWLHTTHGTKIERGLELRQRGSGLAIIPEDHWMRFIEQTPPNGGLT